MHFGSGAAKSAGSVYPEPMSGPSESVLHPNPGDISIRLATADDQGPINGIFMEDTITEGVTVIDASGLVDEYLGNEDSRLWIAEHTESGEPVGIVGVWHADDHIAELRRLRVMTRYRKRGIGRRLVETALSHCRERAYLKITLDTYVNRAAAIALFEAFGFELARTREVDGKKVQDFYLNLYRDVVE